MIKSLDLYYHPMIKPNQIPLFNSIINHSDKYNESISINSDNNTNSGGYSYYRELNWLIEIINQGNFNSIRFIINL